MARIGGRRVRRMYAALAAVAAVSYAGLFLECFWSPLRVTSPVLVSVGVCRGCFVVESDWRSPPRGCMGYIHSTAAGLNRSGVAWWPIVAVNTVRCTGMLACPVWIPLCGAIGMAVWTYRRHAATEDHLCQRCGYDLRGFGHGRECPECGATAAEGTRATTPDPHLKARR
ncbi:MAG: hypothetical protein KF745_14145 [Phycisphaeraceae bacterium]|nr:hypothetical protein [Phycisphaeraceae bacterium]